MLNSSFGDQIIEGEFNYMQQLENGVDQYSVMTSKDDEGNVYAAIVNLNLEGQDQVKIQIDDLDLTGKTMEIQHISGDTFYAENTLNNPDNVDVQRSTVTINDAAASVTLAPHSFTVVKIVDAFAQEPEPAVNTEELQAAINEYGALQEADYTADSWTQFQAALDAARGVLNAQTQEEVDAALEMLQTARANLANVQKPAPSETKPASGGSSGQTVNQDGQDSGTPQTGDSIRIAAVIMLLISGCIIVTCLKRKRMN